MKKALLVILSEHDISTFPAVFQTAMELKKRDWEIVLITKADIGDANLEVYFNKYIKINKENSIKMFNLINKENPNVVICYRENDAKYCFLTSKLLSKVKYYYYNLEIYTYPSQNDAGVNLFRVVSRKLKYYFIKFLEISYMKRCEALIIQDEIRERISKIHGIGNLNTFHIPNSYYYNDSVLLEPSEGKASLLITGGLEGWALETFMQRLPQLVNCRITLSGWSRDGLLNTYKSQLENYSNIEILSVKLSNDEYTSLVEKFGIGLIWYSKIDDDNIYNIGMSSGKFFKYLSMAKPVIVRNLPGLADEVNKHDLGIVIDDISEIEDAVKKICSNYEEYQQRIIEMYKKNYDYGKASKVFFDAM